MKYLSAEEREAARVELGSGARASDLAARYGVCARTIRRLRSKSARSTVSISLDADLAAWVRAEASGGATTISSVVSHAIGRLREEVDR